MKHLPSALMFFSTSAEYLALPTVMENDLLHRNKI